MANPFYRPGKERAAKVNDLFAAIAPRYDRVNDLQSLGLHRFWKKRLVTEAAPRPGERALDLCCGTGDLAFRLSQCGVQVVGLDFSEPMLRVAQARGQKILQTRPGPLFAPPAFLQGDAQKIPLANDSFEIVTIGYGLRNLADWKAGVQEMTRVIKPGGRLLILEFGKPDNVAWRALYFSYLRLFVPLLGRAVCGNADAYAYILESLKHYPAQHGVAAHLRELGWQEVRVINMLGGIMSIHYAKKPGGDSRIANQENLSARCGQ